jgi:hypothetical protein
MKTLQAGRVAGVFVGIDPASFVTTRQREAVVTFEGFVGDRHSGLTRRSDGRTPHYPRGTEIRNSRQVSLVSIEELAEVADAIAIPTILPEWMGANVVTTGIPRLTQLPPSTRLFFEGGAVLVVEGENPPCSGPGEVIQLHHPFATGLAARFVEAAQHRRGIVAWVERPGAIHEGDAISIQIPPQVLYSP